jgi:hypothetical protein
MPSLTSINASPGDDEHEQALAERVEERFQFNDPLRQAQERLDAIERGEPDPALTPPAPPAPPIPGRGVLADVPLQVVGGVRDAVVEIGQAIESAGDWLREHSPLIKSLDKAAGGKVQVSIPEVPGAETMGAGFVRGVSQFLTGFIPGGKIAKLLKIPTAFGKATAAGALADALVFDPNDPTLGNVIEGLVSDAPEALRGTLMDYITIREDDTEAQKRLKRVLEGAGLGVAAEGVFQGAKALRALWKNSRAAGGAGAQAAEAVEGIPRPEPVRAPGVKPVALPEADDVTALSKRFQAAVERQRRGTRPIEQAMKEAQEAFPEGKMSADYLRTLYPGTALTDTEAVALIETVAESASKLQTLGKGVLTGDAPWERFMDQLSTFAQIEPLRLGVEAEGGRTLRVLGDPIIGKRRFIEQATKALQKAEGGLTREQIAQAFAEMKSLQELVQVSRNLAKPGWWDLFVEVRVNGLLSGPRTFVVNSLGNSAALSETIFERFAAERLGTGVVAPGEAHAMLTGVVQSWGDSMRLAAKSFRGEVPEMLGQAVKIETRFGREQVFARVLREKLGDFGSWLDGVETLINTPGRALMAADDFFKSIAFNAELRALARREAYQTARAEGLEALALAPRVAEIEQRLLANPPAYLKGTAQDFAAYVTFTRDVTGHTAEAIAKFTQTPVGQFVVPFSRTPQNIFKFTLERTPVAPLLPSVRQALQAGGVERELALTRIYTGSMLMAFTGLLAYNGVITGGGPTDSQLKHTLRLTGWQPYSVKIGNTWISYGRLDPLGSILGMAADFVEVAGELKEEQKNTLAVGMVAALYKNLGSKTFLRGIADAVDAIADPDRKLFDAAQSALASVVPFSSLLRQARTAVDPTLVEMRGLLDATRRLIPGFGPEAAPRRDLFGNKILLPPGLGASLLGPLAGLFIPFAVSTDKDDPVANRLTGMRFQHSPLRPQISGIELTPGQFDRYQVLAGDGLRQELAKLFLQPGFNASSAEVQRGLVSQLAENRRELARAKVVEEFPDLGAAVRTQTQQKFHREVRQPADRERLREIALEVGRP